MSHFSEGQNESEHAPDEAAELAKRKRQNRALLYAIPFCLVMAVIEFNRALGGNQRSIAYTLEWPFFGVFIYYMYWKLSQPQPDYSEEEDNEKSPE
jgi:hypothetical protein